MCINVFEKYSDDEKVSLLKDYVDYLTIGDCQNYDLFCDLDNNNVLKRKFLRACVPFGYDDLDLKKVFKSNNNLKKIQKRAMYQYRNMPLFYIMCCVCGALDCYNENLSLKKILGRGSKILLSY